MKEIRRKLKKIWGNRPNFDTTFARLTLPVESGKGLAAAKFYEAGASLEDIAEATGGLVLPLGSYTVATLASEWSLSKGRPLPVPFDRKIVPGKDIQAQADETAERLYAIWKEQGGDWTCINVGVTVQVLADAGHDLPVRGGKETQSHAGLTCVAAGDKHRWMYGCGTDVCVDCGMVRTLDRVEGGQRWLYESGAHYSNAVYVLWEAIFEARPENKISEYGFPADVRAALEEFARATAVELFLEKKLETATPWGVDVLEDLLIRESVFENVKPGTVARYMTQIGEHEAAARALRLMDEWAVVDDVQGLLEPPRAEASSSTDA